MIGSTIKLLFQFSFLFHSILLGAQTRYDVSSGAEFSSAHNQATAGDTIAWLPGAYSNTRMDIDKDGLIVTAKPYGTVLFTGVSRAVINADEVTFSGFQYVGGLIGNLDVIRIFGSDVLITHVNIQNYTSHKYLVVDEESRRTIISYCNFENRLNSDDKNILSILVDNEPGYHKIQHCSFKNFDGIGKDQGIEPIRIGVSTQSHLDSRTLVEYCYFTECSGDGEIISHKARQNVYRYNTFENNPVGELVLRHGDQGIIYGNFFINNKGGIRIREGSGHFIYNNYFDGINDRAIWLMNDPADPVSDVHIYHNTIINSENLRLGGDGRNPPSNVTIANNVFANPIDQLFNQETGNEIWINNIAFGNLGIDSSPTGLLDTDPMLYENAAGFFQPESDSPVITSAMDGYPAVPLFEGMEYDNEISLDLMKESRPVSITDRAIGASEFLSTSIVQPHATELNTGPSYLFENLVDYLAANASQLFIGKEGESRSIRVSSNIDWTVIDTTDWISTDLSFGSGDNQLTISIDPNVKNARRSGTLTITGGTESVTIVVNQDADQTTSVIDIADSDVLQFPNPTEGKINLQNLPSGIHSSFIEVIHLDGRSVFAKEYRIIDNELVIDLNKVVPGTYVLHMKLMTQNGTIDSELSSKLVIN